MAYPKATKNPEILQTISWILAGENTRTKLSIKLAKSPQAIDKQVKAVKELISEVKAGRGRGKETSYSINWDGWFGFFMKNYIEDKKDVSKKSSYIGGLLMSALSFVLKENAKSEGCKETFKRYVTTATLNEQEQVSIHELMIAFRLSASSVHEGLRNGFYCKPVDAESLETLGKMCSLRLDLDKPSWSYSCEEKSMAVVDNRK
jgi:hypothetical protein